MKKMLIVLGIAAILAVLAVPAVLAQQQQAEQQPCTTWGCIKCLYNPRCGKGNG